METDWVDGVIRTLKGFLTGSEDNRYVEAFLQVENPNFEEKIIIKYKKALELGLIGNHPYCTGCGTQNEKNRGVCPNCKTSLETTIDNIVENIMPIGVRIKLKSKNGGYSVSDIQRK